MDSKPYIFAFIDLETTGHDPIKGIGGRLIPWHEVIEIGATFADPITLDLRGEFAVKVKPEYPERCLPDLINDYPRRAIEGEWDNAVPLTAGIHHLLNYCLRLGAIAIPIGQNFFFDWSFLSVAFAWCGIMEDEWRKSLHYSRLDTRSMVVQELLSADEAYDPARYSFRNETLSKRLGIPTESCPHKALNGSRQALLIYKKLREFKKLRFDEAADEL